MRIDECALDLPCYGFAEDAEHAEITNPPFVAKLLVLRAVVDDRLVAERLRTETVLDVEVGAGERDCRGLSFIAGPFDRGSLDQG